jgi:rRNA maturation RNase YbeY
VQEVRIPHLQNLKRLPQWVESILRQEQCRVSRIQYTFVDDKSLLALNRQYLQHDTYTDILTFQYEGDPIEGDIYISYDRVLENSRLYSVTPVQEILRVIAHGALHLCGWSDETPAESDVMRKREDACLALYGH